MRPGLPYFFATIERISFGIRATPPCFEGGATKAIMVNMRFAFQAAVLAAVLTAPCRLIPQADGSQASTERLAQIDSALQAGKFDRAIELLRPELGQNPKNARLWTLEGIALSGNGDKKGALAAFRHALGIAPDYLAALEGAAQIEYESNDKDAAAFLQHILALRPGDTTSNAMLAEIAYRQGNCAAAIPHFEQSGTILDSQPAALQHYGDCLIRTKDTEKAITVFERGLAQPGAGTGARYRLASAQMIAQRPKDAIATLRPLIENNTTDVEILELAAAAFEADGNTPDAVRILRQAIVDDPHNVDLYVDFANLCLDHQSYQVGVDMMGAGLEAEPKAAPLYAARGILYVQLAQYDKAEADFDKADALDPNQSFASAAEGLAALQQNDPDRALATVREKLIRKPNDAFLLYSQAELLAQRGPEPDSVDFHEAVKSAEKAVALSPSLGTARDFLAKLYLEAGQNSAAIEQSRKALSLDPKDQTALYRLIQSLRKSGRQEEVPALLQRLAALRMEGAQEESQHNRYKLIEQNTP
jgi:tetratricopeptide (TPR) repeat protein